MKALFRSALAVLLILSLSLSAFAWYIDENPIYGAATFIEVDTPVAVSVGDVGIRCFYFRLDKAGYVQLEIDRPLSENTKMSLVFGDAYNQYLLYDTVLPTETAFLSPEIGLDANSDDYYPDNDPNRAPLVTWRGHGSLLFINWLNYFVYQSTPYDIKEIQ